MANDKNLYQRISAVMQDVEYLKKDDSIGSGNYAYKAISEEKVTETVRASLIKNGLVILPIKQKHRLNDQTRPDRNGQATIVPISTVDTKYKIVNIDNPAEFEILCSSGTGVDPQDKGVGKAMTYSYKYLLLRTFAIPTGEDPDKVHNNDLSKQQAPVVAKKATAEKAMQSATTPKVEAAATADQVSKIKELINNDLITPAEEETANTRLKDGLTETAAEKAIKYYEGLINSRTTAAA